MGKSYIKRACLITQILFLVLTIYSCSSTKKIKYFQDIPDSGQTKTIPKAEYTDPIIRVGDLLNVQVAVIDPSATSMVNSGNVSSAETMSSALAGGSGASGLLASLAGGNQAQPTPSGYTVDKDGNIDIPIIGKVKAAGLTTYDLRNVIYNEAVKYYKNPTITVKLTNFKVSVTGEVLKPGQYIMSDERVSVLDAIAMAGDLTIFGKRENVLLIRENPDGSKTAYRLNLKKSDIMSSPVYYLRQNDIIYVEPRKAKSDANDASQARYISIIGTIFSIILVFATRRN